MNFNFISDMAMQFAMYLLIEFKRHKKTCSSWICNSMMFSTCGICSFLVLSEFLPSDRLPKVCSFLRVLWFPPPYLNWPFQYKWKILDWANNTQTPLVLNIIIYMLFDYKFHCNTIITDKDYRWRDNLSWFKFILSLMTDH